MDTIFVFSADDVAGADVIERSVAGDVVQSFFLAHVDARFADHDGELDFVIQIFYFRRMRDIVFGADHGSRSLRNATGAAGPFFDAISAT